MMTVSLWVLFLGLYYSGFLLNLFGILFMKNNYFEKKAITLIDSIFSGGLSNPNSSPKNFILIGKPFDRKAVDKEFKSF